MIDVAAASTALIVVDMQNDFCSADGYYATVGRDLAIPAHGAAEIRLAPERQRVERAHLIATGLMIACTAPVMREGPSVNRNSQAWSFTISSVFMFSRM